jgi:p-aminobenzoyl-glutamate transporter AbgT
VLLYVVLSTSPRAALVFGGPWATLVVAPMASLVWALLGPKPFPGLLPGLAATSLLLVNAGYWFYALYVIVQRWIAGA